MRSDVLLAFVGIALSVTVFFAQGPYGGVWQYFFGLSPLLLTLGSLATIRAIDRVRRLRNLVALATSTRTSVTSLVRAQNDLGDAILFKRYHILLVTDVTEVRATREQSVYTDAVIEGVPPDARIISTGKTGRRLVSRLSYQTTTEHGDGTILKKYVWSYDILPPLTGRGDFVEFAHEVLMRGTLAKAFSAEGDEYFWERVNYESGAEVFIVAPPSYQVEILDAWIVEFDGRRIQPAADDMPDLTTAGTTMRWQLPALSGARYACRFRFRH